MKSLGKYLFLIITIGFSVALVLEVIYTNSSQLIKNDISDEKSVWDDIYSSSINVDIAIYGSSRAWVHVNPHIIDSILNVKSYNMGIDGYAFDIQYYRHKEYFKYNNKPKDILLLIDWHSFSNREGLYNSIQFIRHTLWNANAIEYLGRKDSVNILDFYIPYYRYRGKENIFRNQFQENKKLDLARVKGFKSFNRVWVGKRIKPFNISIDDEVVQMMDNFLKEMKLENIQVTLVVAPYFIEGQNAVLNKNHYQKIIEKFSRDYSLSLLDYSQSKLSFNKEYFYNSMHLNSKGANLFSLQLARDLKKNNKKNFILN